MRSIGFANGRGLDIHTRTTRIDNRNTGSYSYISGVAIRIGSDILEWTDTGSIFANGNDVSDPSPEDPSEGTATIAGFTLKKTMRGKKRNIMVHDLILSESSSIQVRVNAKIGMLFVDVKGQFQDSVGLLGTQDDEGHGVLARDGQTSLSGLWNSFGEEWQVRDYEAKLFKLHRDPQYPAGCHYHSKVSKGVHLRRRLLESGSKNAAIDIDGANIACMDASERMKGFCVDDVMATGDVELAEDSFYSVP
jgi:hypothetical protein